MSAPAVSRKSVDIYVSDIWPKLTGKIEFVLCQNIYD